MNNPIKAIKIIVKTIIAFFITGIALLFFIQKAEYVEGSGMIIANKCYNIYAPTTGEIKKVYKDFGDRIDKNETLIEIDGQEVEKRLIENELEINNINSNLKANVIKEENIKNEENNRKTRLSIMQLELENAKQEYDNIEYMAERGEKSKYEVKKAEIEIKKQELEIDAIKKNDTVLMQMKQILQERDNFNKQYEYYRKKTEELKQELGKSTIKVQYNNLIIITPNVKELEGAIVNKGNVICSLADINNLRMVISLKENEIGKVKIGQKAMIFLDAIPYEKFTTLEGSIVKLYPQAKETNTYDKVEVEIEGFTHKLTKEKLKNINIKSGLKGRAKIVVKDKKMFIQYMWDKIFE